MASGFFLESALWDQRCHTVSRIKKVLQAQPLCPSLWIPGELQFLPSLSLNLPPKLPRAGGGASPPRCCCVPLSHSHPGTRGDVRGLFPYPNVLLAPLLERLPPATSLPRGGEICLSLLGYPGNAMMPLLWEQFPPSAPPLTPLGPRLARYTCINYSM